MKSWHRDDETKQIIYDRVEEPVGQGLSRHVFNTFEPIVDIQLGCHVDEAEGVNGTNQSIEDE